MQSVVRRIVSGSASADYVSALKNLREAADDLSMDIPWRGATARKMRQIELLQQEIEEKKGSLSEARAAAATVEESRDRLAALEAELAETRDVIGNKRAWQEALESFGQAIKDRRILEQQVNEYRQKIRQVEKLDEELKRFQDKIDSEYSQFVHLPDEAASDVAGLAQMIDGKKEIEERCRRVEADAIPFRLSRPALATIATGAILALAGLLFLEGFFRFCMIFLGTAVSIAAIGYPFFSWRSQQLEQQGKLEELKRQIESVRNQIEELQERYPALAQSAPAEFLGKLSEFKQILNKKKELEAALGQHSGLEETVSEYNRLSNELVIGDNKISALTSQRPSLGDIEDGGRHGSEIEEVRDEIERLERRLTELAAERDEVVRAHAAAEALETVSEETLEDEIEEAESRLERLQLSRDAHVMAVEALEEAESEFRESHLLRIGDRTTHLLAQITGLDCSVHLDGKLEPTGLQREGQSLALEQLSQGVLDQLYFALRLASVEEIAGERRLPVLLDDPFVNFDESRLKAALETLDKLSESHQIVLLTHDRRYSNWRKPARILGR
jgi:DNA repair exonuclease SbcCD ATPase subunit